MNVYEESQEGGTPPKAAKPDPMKEFKAMPSTERWLALVAVAVILAYLIQGLSLRYWGDRFFDVCSLIGCMAVLALVVPHLFGVRYLQPRVRMFAFAAAGVLPAVGFVIDSFSQPWRALMLAGTVVMALMAWQIAERERLIK